MLIDAILQWLSGSGPILMWVQLAAIYMSGIYVANKHVIWRKKYLA